MSYTTSYIEEDNIVCITASGRVTTEEYRKGSKEVVDLLAKHDSTRLFVDDRLLDNAASILDFYELPEFFRKIGLPSRVRVALLYDATGTDKRYIEFFETVCRNSGYTVTIFYSYDEAMEWLKSK